MDDSPLMSPARLYVQKAIYRPSCCAPLGAPTGKKGQMTRKTDQFWLWPFPFLQLRKFAWPTSRDQRLRWHRNLRQIRRRRFQSDAKDRSTTVIHSVASCKANCKVGFTCFRVRNRKSSSVALRININDIRMEMCATSTTVGPSVQTCFNRNKNFFLDLIRRQNPKAIDCHPKIRSARFP